MKEIILDQLKITNFKGIRLLGVTFDRITDICGDNATGKTTIMDAFLWLLFGKDSTERTQFEIKHVGHNGNGSPQDVEVEGDMTVDGQRVTLRRVLREKWQKRRGSAEAEFAGNETIYFFNDVPVTMREYQEKVSAICPEDVFKMLTNPCYFNTLKWTSQREILFDMAGGELPDEVIARGRPAFERLLGELSGKTLDEYKRQLANKKRRIKEQLDVIPSRIDEVNRSKPREENWDQIAGEMAGAKRELAGIEAAIADRSRAYEEVYAKRVELQKRLHAAKEKLDAIVSAYRHQVMGQYREAEACRNDSLSRVKALQWEIIQKEKRLAVLEQQLADNRQRRDLLRQQWHQQNQRQFTPPGDDNHLCPACKRPFDAMDMEERRGQLLAAFNRDRVTRLEAITDEGRSLKHSWEELLDQKQAMMRDIARQKQEAGQLQGSLMEELSLPVIRDEDAPGYRDAKQAVDVLSQEYEAPLGLTDPDELKKRKAILQSLIMQRQGALALKEQIQRADARVVELSSQQKELAQHMADLEKAEYTIELFERAKSDATQKKINSLFGITRWKLYETQVNGQEVPTCKATHKGVPYADLNSAARTNVGLDIINTLARHYGLTAPIFIDNREGVNSLIDTPSQLINLIVTKDPQLIIKPQKSHGKQHIAEQAQAH